jgi:hypothetical protein
MKDDEKILKKIRKLLRMSKDKGSPNEAANALRMARKLADKHQLDLKAVDEDDMQELIYRSYVDERHPPAWLSTLCYGSALMNDCVMRLSMTPDRDYVFVFAGHRNDTQVCAWTCDYLWNTLVDQSEQRELEPLQFEPFAIGYCSAVMRRITAMVQERQQERGGEGGATDDEQTPADKDNGSGGGSGGDMIALKQSLVEQKFGKSKVKRDADSTPSNFDEFMTQQSGYNVGSGVPLDSKAMGRD